MLFQKSAFVNADGGRGRAPGRFPRAVMFVLNRQEQLIVVFVLTSLLLGSAIRQWRHRLEPIGPKAQPVVGSAER